MDGLQYDCRGFSDDLDVERGAGRRIDEADLVGRIAALVGRRQRQWNGRPRALDVGPERVELRRRYRHTRGCVSVDLFRLSCRLSMDHAPAVRNVAGVLFFFFFPSTHSQFYFWMQFARESDNVLWFVDGRYSSLIREKKSLRLLSLVVAFFLAMEPTSM